MFFIGQSIYLPTYMPTYLLSYLFPTHVQTTFPSIPLAISTLFNFSPQPSTQHIQLSILMRYVTQLLRRSYKDSTVVIQRDPSTGQPQVLGSGCVAQVFRGKLIRPSENKKGGYVEIAVKVTHPDIRGSISAGAVTIFIVVLARRC